MSTCPKYLRPFIPARALTEIVRDLYRSRLPSDRDLQNFAALPAQEKCGIGARLGPEFSEKLVTVSFEELAQHRDAARKAMTTTKLGYTAAEVLRNMLMVIADTSRQDRVLATPAGADTRVTNAFLFRMMMPESYAPQVAPLLAAEFTRLAAIPELPLPRAQLSHDTATGEIRIASTVPPASASAPRPARNRARVLRLNFTLEQKD